jgi:hypothetical protein
LYGLSTTSVELKKNSIINLNIKHPTFFHRVDDFLIYPGENVFARIDSIGDYHFTIQNNEQRNNEL